MHSKNALKSPPLLGSNDCQHETSRSYSKFSALSVGGVANKLMTASEGSTSKPVYQSFDSHDRNDSSVRDSDHPNSFPSSLYPISSKTSIPTHYPIVSLFCTLLLCIVGAAVVCLSFICHDSDHSLHFGLYLDDSYFILCLCIGSTMLLCSLCKLVLSLTACGPPKWHDVGVVTLFAVISGTFSLMLSVWGLTTVSIGGHEVSYPRPLLYFLSGYPLVVIIGFILSHLLPIDHRSRLHPVVPICSWSDSVDAGKSREDMETVPEYIRKYGRAHPFDRSTFKMIWHSFTHQWAWPILQRGYQQPLEVEDCYNVPVDDHVLSQTQIWDHYIALHGLDVAKLTTFQCLWQLEGRGFIFRCCWYMVGLLTSLAVPFLISALSDFYEDANASTSVGLWLSLGLWAAAFARIENVSFVFTSMCRAWTRCRALLIYVIYRKALSTSLSGNGVEAERAHSDLDSMVSASVSLGAPSQSQSQSSIGRTITMMGSDTRTISWAFAMIHFFLANMVFVLIICALLFAEIGPSAFVGWFFFIAITGPIQGWIAKLVHRASKLYIMQSDVRVKLIGELIRGIGVTKMYCWEPALMDKVFGCRRSEMEQLLKRVRYQAFLSMINISSPHLMILLMLGVYVGVFGNELTLRTTFTVITLVQLLRIAIRVIPWGITLIVGSMVSLKRLDDFFAADQQSDIQRKINELNARNATQHDEAVDGNSMVTIKDATFKWDDVSQFKLHRVSLDLERGKLYALVGLVGSGKSSLIQAILGEMSMTDGALRVRGDREQVDVQRESASGRDGRHRGAQSIGYVSQRAFIINATVRENILFGLEYRRSFYLECIAAAALNDDLRILGNGDLTEIGERGINLSGGQKARISFARALYRREMASLYLLDDPLSAVDVRVGQIMFREGVEKLLAAKTRVIVLNSHLDLLKSVDEVIVMDRGRIAFKGPYSVIQHDEEYLHLLPQPHAGDDAPDQEDGGRTENAKGPGPRQSAQRRASSLEEDAAINVAGDGQHRDRGALTTAEDRGVGSISWSVYSRYFSNSAQPFNHQKVSGQLGGEAAAVSVSTTSVRGVLLIVLELLLLLSAQTFSSCSDIWLSFWAEEDDANRFSRQDEWWWLSVWTAIIAATAVASFCGSYLFGYLSLRAAQSVHMKALYFVLRAPMSFFNATPTGRILNRFSKDTNEMDDELINNFNRFSQDFLMVLGYIVVIIISNFYTLFMLIVLLPILYWIQNKYRPSSRDLKRLTQITLTPIMTQFNETLLGLDTIRAYKLEKYFLDKMVLLTDRNHRVFLTEQMTLRWFSVSMDLIIAVFIFVVALLATLLRDQFPTALLSLSVVYGYGLMGMLQWSISSSVEVEKNFTSIERLLHFEEIESEAESINPFHRAPQSWPHRGDIEIKDLRMKYREDLEYVLKGVTVSIGSAERIGIVGRTGAGKSSLFKALFRTVEPERGSVITIDGVDVLKLGLQDLRQCLSIIPQDPVLFSGDIRFNLDPFGQHSDESIWSVLKSVELFDFVEQMENGLLSEVKEDGSNFSQGQKQLICIGRALLKQSRILLLDEATSSIDKYTDQLIQKVIREQFENRTVLCIAHRLETILDYDKILVLSDGNIVEYDTPQKLLQKEHGDESAIFKNMVNLQGESANSLPSEEVSVEDGLALQEEH